MHVLKRERKAPLGPPFSVSPTELKDTIVTVEMPMNCVSSACYVDANIKNLGNHAIIHNMYTNKRESRLHMHII